METYRTGRLKVKYNDFSGGYQTFTSPLWTSNNEAQWCKNIDIRKPGTLKKALGYSQVGSGTTGTPPRGLFIYDSEDGTSTPYKLTNNVLQKYTASAWSSVTGGSGFATGSNHARGIVMYINTGTGIGSGADTFVERMYIASGLDDNVRYTNGTSITALANIYAKHIESYKGRIYLGNVKQGSATHPIRVMYSDTTVDDFPSNNYFDDMSEPITALKEYAGSLFVFSQNKLAAYDGYRLQVIPGNYGTTSQESVQIVEGKMIWYNRGGVFMYAGSSLPQDISRKINDFIQAITDATAVTAGIDGEGRYNLYIGNVTVDGTSYNKVVLRYDAVINSWDILPDRPFKYWITQKSGGVFKAYASDVADDKVWLVGGSQALNSSAMVSEWVTSKLDSGEPDTYKDYRKVYITYKPTNKSEYLTVQYRVNGDTSWSNIGGTTNNISLLGTQTVKTSELILPKATNAKMIQFKISHSSSANGFEIYEITPVYDERKQGSVQ